ncbi:dihydrolipoyl dehydrogenase [Paenalkalicoccus suaedae]|uniref:Dihydrolipoyl dehydrogenase n=1 Tax=Paenalkalicoccus suaedae TaxID=2592382 RepID=A0A859FCM0_9BACI|nr:dihydrolipoyl dehydrogenase [Paenalkalicoccus suaedae]QKS70979.1 dihydrolipoyl dehydrogenase [Paenalkalicoccus suaedae]
MAKEYDLVIIGAGTGGYVAAIRAAQLGKSVAVVEKSQVGGTCLHKGCIPSKALLRSAEVFKTINQAEEFGVEVSGSTLNFQAVMDRKDAIVNQLHKGVQALMKKGKIDIYEGFARILGPSIFSPTPGTISIEYKEEDRENDMLIPSNVLIATGSRPRSLKGLTLDEDRVLSSEGALSLTELPKSIGIIGGGVIGVEWASMFADFGVEVTVFEYTDRVLPTEDRDISKEMKKALEKKGVNVLTSAQVLAEEVKTSESDVTVPYELDGEKQSLTFEKILVSVGREANVTNIGLENTDIQVENGVIKVNEHYQTKESHMYAVGDVIGGLQLAHVASHEGIAAVEHMANLEAHPVDPLLVAKCTYSSPEVASVGLTEQDAKDKGYDVKVGKFPFQAVGKALVYGDTTGFVKFVTDSKTEDLLGVHMIGPHVTDMISEAALAKLLDATHWEVAASIHPHPSLSEAIGEAALAVDGIQIHG